MFFIYFYLLLIGILKANTNNEMIFIQSGKYIPIFKSDNLKENAYVNVESFFLDKYPVTNYDFKKFILENKKWKKNNIKQIFADKNYLSHWKNVNFELIKNFPVVNVSWFSAEAYCSYKNKRLPTVNEWEYIASLQENNNKEISNYNLSWYLNNKTKKIKNINLMQKNSYGIFGINETIWEWVYDFNSIMMLNADSEGGGLEELLYCGATAINSIDPKDYAAFMRFAFRNNLEANYTMSYLGFRCAKNEK